MIKLIFLSLFFLLSLLVVFRAPTNLLWYVSILVTEFSWVFIALIFLLLAWPSGRYAVVSWVIGLSGILLLSVPYWQCWHLGRKVAAAFSTAFPQTKALQEQPAFHPLQIFTGMFSPRLPFQTMVYDTTHQLALDFYPAQEKGQRPCIIVIHGGSWAGGDKLQLPELNSEMARWGFHVASINYRLAPDHLYPSPVEDVQSAINFLRRQATALFIDSSRLVLLGRSAGAQIALSAAYTLHENAIRGVINFYGPADMVWGYENPTNPLVLDSRKVMEDYLGGSLDEVREQYLHSSATETATSHTPPTLMIYAEHDPLVSPRHGNRLAAKLRQLNRPYFELYLPWATHGFDYSLNGPGGQLSTWTAKHFLKAILNDDR